MSRQPKSSGNFFSAFKGITWRKMKVSELIVELKKIADQGDAWKDAEVEWYGTKEETEKRGGPCALGEIEQLDFGDHLLVVISAAESP